MGYFGYARVVACLVKDVLDTGHVLQLLPEQQVGLQVVPVGAGATVHAAATRGLLRLMQPSTFSQLGTACRRSRSPPYLAGSC